jgi:hypothetical protein
MDLSLGVGGEKEQSGRWKSSMHSHSCKVERVGMLAAHYGTQPRSTEIWPEGVGKGEAAEGK